MIQLGPEDSSWASRTANKDGFLAIAALLLEKEVIFADDLERILGPRKGSKDSLMDAPEEEPGDAQEVQPVDPSDTTEAGEGQEKL